VSHQPFAQGHGGEGRGSQRAELRPEDVPDRHVSLRRIGRLFIPYRLRLGLLLGLIFLGSILSVASPFLLREAARLVTGSEVIRGNERVGAGRGIQSENQFDQAVSPVGDPVKIAVPCDCVDIPGRVCGDRTATTPYSAVPLSRKTSSAALSTIGEKRGH